jgi:RimJ/RimL family protein N-acetyltransferase
LDPVLIDVPMPIRTPRLVLRPKQVGDGAITAAAVAETWDELHKWMRWAEHRDAFTDECMEIRNRRVMASFILREGIELMGVEAATGRVVIWCGLHDIDWQGRQCDTGYWVRKSAQTQGFATEGTNALVRFGFGALGMRRIGLTHSAGMRRADALPNDSASPSKESREGQMCFRMERAPTGTATLDLTLRVCPIWKCSGRAIGIRMGPISPCED